MYFPSQSTFTPYYFIYPNLITIDLKVWFVHLRIYKTEFHQTKEICKNIRKEERSLNSNTTQNKHLIA